MGDMGEDHVEEEPAASERALLKAEQEIAETKFHVDKNQRRIATLRHDVDKCVKDTEGASEMSDRTARQWRLAWIGLLVLGAILGFFANRELDTLRADAKTNRNEIRALESQIHKLELQVVRSGAEASGTRSNMTSDSAANTDIPWMPTNAG